MFKITDCVKRRCEYDWNPCFFYLPRQLQSEDGAKALYVWLESGEKRLVCRVEPPLEIHETWEVRFLPDSTVWTYTVVREIEAFG